MSETENKKDTARLEEELKREYENGYLLEVCTYLGKVVRTRLELEAWPLASP